MQLHSRDRLYCVTYASGGKCSHKHQRNLRQKCNECFNLFTSKALPVFNECVSEFSVNMDDTKHEIDSMIQALPYIQEVLIWFMSHRLRAKVQFNAITKIKEELKTNPDHVLVVLDHKQKFFPMKYYEGQVEYFSKKGMYIFGFMTVSHYSGNENGDQGGFQYEFVDVFVEGYNGQDNIQVA